MIGAAFFAAGLITAYAPPPPKANLSPQPNFNQICAETNKESQACFLATMSALDFARHQEGLGSLYLPRNWRHLTPAEQLLIITNLERAARGEAPIPGLTAGLDAVAKTGAVHQRDPSVKIGPFVSIWARSESPLASDYDWMYDDGWNGPFRRTSNLACTSAAAAGCWGHRANILAEWHRRLLVNLTGHWYPAAGAAQVVVPADVVGFMLPQTAVSDTMIVTAYPQRPTYLYTWREAVAEGAGNPKTGWNPVASSRVAFLWESWAWMRGHAIDAIAAVAIGVIATVSRIRRRRSRVGRTTKKVFNITRDRR